MIAATTTMAAVLGVLLSLSGLSPADPLPSDRRIDWSPGIPGGIPDVPVAADVTDFGATGDGRADDSAAIQAAIDTVDSGAVYLPPGLYRLTSGLRIGRSVVLRGAGPDSTRLIFDIDARSPVAIAIVRYDRGPYTAVTSGHAFGSTRLTVDDGGLFSAGDFAEIRQDNDPRTMYTDDRWEEPWAAASVGQVVRIHEVSEDTLFLDGPLHQAYRSSLDPRIRRQGLVTRAGVEHLSITLTERGDPVTIGIKNAAFCWVRNVRSTLTSRRHVGLSTAFRCVVRDSRFEDAHEFGGGGHGYGVAASNRTTGCLVENNVFRRLRHAMLVQTGASGNVYAYNFSTEPKAAGDWTPCDISLHGHWPYMNLFEGNTVHEIDVSDYWGPCGPGNTFLRNRVRYEGIDILDHSHGQNIIGNLVGTGENGIHIHESVAGTFVVGNRPGKSSPVDIPASYYLDAKPGFFGEGEWPVNGAERAAPLPAQLRYERSQTRGDSQELR